LVPFLMQIQKNKEYLTLKEASRIFGYHADYLGWLIREGRVEGRKFHKNTFWKVRTDAFIEYCNRKKKEIKKTPLIRKEISLKTAAAISDYTPNYIAQLIRNGEIAARKVRTQVSWLISKDGLARYRQAASNGSDFEAINKDNSFVINPGINLSLSGLKKGLHSVSRQVQFLSLTALVFAVLFFIGNSGFSINHLQGAVSAFVGEDTDAVNLYTANSYGQWQNAEKVQGPPEIGPDGELAAFSAENSTTYRIGALNLFCEGFGNIHDFSESEFQGAKIKISLAIGEKSTDINIQDEESPVLDGTGPNPAPDGAGEELGFLGGIRALIEGLRDRFVYFMRFLAVKLNSIARAEDIPFVGSTEPFVVEDVSSVNDEESSTTPSEEGEAEATTTELIAASTEETPSTGSGRAASTESTATSTEEIATTTDVTATSTGSTATTTVTTAEDILPDLDSRIVIYWSFNGTSPAGEWNILDEISSSNLSNQLNGGYFEYDAYFLSSWQDISSLRIKVEGVAGGSTNVTVYLDSVWVEAEYLANNPPAGGATITDETATTTDGISTSTGETATPPSEEGETSTTTDITPEDEGAGPMPETPLEEIEETEDKLDSTATTTEETEQEQATTTDDVEEEWRDLTPEISLMFRSVLGGDDSIDVPDIFKGMVKTFWIMEFDWQGEKYIFSQEDPGINWERQDNRIIGTVERENSSFTIEYSLNEERLVTGIFFTNNTEYPVEKLVYKFYIRYPSGFILDEENLLLGKGKDSINFEVVSKSENRSITELFKGLYLDGAEVLIREGTVEVGGYSEAGVSVISQLTKENSQGL